MPISAGLMVLFNLTGSIVSQNISNGLVAFSGGGEVHAPNDKHAVS